MTASMDQWNWYGVNFARIKQLFPDAVFDTQLCRWFKIHHFPLPPNWHQTETQLLVILPGLNGDIYLQPPNEFYVNKGLRTINGLKPEHVFEEPCDYNRRARNGWARYSWHFNDWRPSPDVVSGDNLVYMLEILYLSLGVLAEETDG
jgi:hypothetical protein